MEDNDNPRGQFPFFGDGDALGAISLLYPPNRVSSWQEAGQPVDPAAWHDLGLDTLVAAFSGNKAHQKDIKDILAEIMTDPGIIRYRQEILSDLLENPALVERLSSILPVLDSLTQFSFHPEQERSTLHEVTWRIGELQSIMDCIEVLDENLRNLENGLKSQGLQALLAAVHQLKRKPVYQSLVKNLPDLLAQLRACASVTIGVNLDQRLRPIQATLLSVNEKPFTNQSLLNRLFSTNQENVGIAPLHSVPPRFVEGPYAFPVDSELGWAMEPMMVPLFADLAKVLDKTAAPIANALKEYAAIHSGILVHLRQGLVFYLGAIRFIKKLQELDLPICLPAISALSERVCQITGSYNVNLAIRVSGVSGKLGSPDRIICNDVHIGADGQILILTGPNQGGKTTYMVGIAIAQLLAQAGCFIPGREAKISPVDNIFTHFPLEERPETDTGRFGEEASRLGAIFNQLTSYSLVLLNESLSNTSFGESLYLAQDIVRILRRVGARVIYATHLHQLANQVEELNRTVQGESKIVSIVSSPVDQQAPGAPTEIRRSYRVENRPPLGQSYARDIASRYGIRYEQLEQVLTKRGIIH